MKANEFYTTYSIDGCGKIWNFVDTVRGIGKTWAFKMRALLKFAKTGNKTLWVRSTQTETKSQISGFFPPQLLEKISGKIDTNELKVTKKCVLYKGAEAIRFASLSQRLAIKGSGGVEEFTDIVYDEFASLYESRYIGDKANDLISTYVSYNRGSPVRVWCLGNKENYYSPILEHFSVNVPLSSPSGIYTGKNWALEIINEPPQCVAELNDSLTKSDKRYLHSGAVLSERESYSKFNEKHISSEFCTFIDGYKLVWGQDKYGNFGAMRGLDTSVPIYANESTPKEWGYAVDIRYRKFPNIEYLLSRLSMYPPFFQDGRTAEIGMGVLRKLSLSRFCNS